MPSGNLAIPTRYYKIIRRTKSDGSMEALTIVLPNLQRGLPPRSSGGGHSPPNHDHRTGSMPHHRLRGASEDGARHP